MYASLYSHLIISLWKSIHLPFVVAETTDNLPRSRNSSESGLIPPTYRSDQSNPPFSPFPATRWSCWWWRLDNLCFNLFGKQTCFFLFQIVLLPLFFLRNSGSISPQKNIFMLYTCFVVDFFIWLMHQVGSISISICRTLLGGSSHLVSG